MKTLRRHLVAVVFRHMLALVFVAAALLKWLDPAGQSTCYGNLAHAAPAIGWAIIVGELLLGAWLISGIRAGLAAGVAFLCWPCSPAPSWRTCWPSTQSRAAASVRRGRRPTARRLSSTAWPWGCCVTSLS